MKVEEKKEGFKAFEVHRSRKNILKFLLTILKSLNPDSYPKLIKRSTKEAYSYLIMLVLTCLIISSLTLTPKLIGLPKELENSFSKVELLRLNPEIKTRESVNFGLGIVLNTNAKNISEENLLITSNRVFKKPLICMLSRELCAFSKNNVKEFSYEEFFNLKERSSELIRVITLLAWLVAPVILILLFIFYTLKYILITAIVALIAYLITKWIKKEYEFKKLLKLSIYSSTIMVLIDVLGKQYYPAISFITLIPFLIYIAFFTIGIIIISGEYNS